MFSLLSKFIAATLGIICFCCGVPGPSAHAQPGPRTVAHFDAVRGVVFGPHGRTLASAGADGAIKVWNLGARAGDIGQVLIAPAAVNSLALSRDGQFLAAGNGRKVDVWNARSGQVLRSLSGPSGALTALALSRDGQFLAGGSDDQSVTLWHAANGRKVRSWSKQAGRIEAVAFSPDGQMLAFAAAKTVTLCRPATGQTLRLFVNEKGSINSIAFSPDGRTLAGGGWDKTVRLWNIAGGETSRIFVGHSSWISAVAFSPDGRSLASAAWDKTIKLWDVPTGTSRATLRGHSGAVLSLSFSPDGQRLASAGDDRTVRLWNVGSGKMLYALGDRPRPDAGSQVLAYRAYWQGRAAFEAGDTARSIGLYRSALHLAPQRFDYAVALADTLRANANFEAATSLLEGKLKTAKLEERQALQPALADVHFDWAQSSVKSGAHAAAIAHFRAAFYIDATRRPDKAAVTLYGLATAYDALHRLDQAALFYARARAGFDKIKDQAGAAAACNGLGLALLSLGRYPAAAAALEQASTLSREVQDREIEGAARNGLGVVYTSLGRSDKALEHLNAALLIKRELKERSGEGIVLNNLGLAYQAINRYDKAIDLFGQALRIHRAAGNAHETAATLNNLGANYHYLGQYGRAGDFYRQALALHRREKNGAQQANDLSNLGYAFFYRRQYVQAKNYLEQALRLRRAARDVAGEGATLSDLGATLNALGRFERATTLIEQSLDIARRTGDREGVGLGLYQLGQIELSRRRYARAVQRLEESLVIFREVRARAREANALHFLMLAWKALNRPRLAVFVGKRAVNAYQEIRAHLSGLDKSVQRSFLASKQDTYRELADLLIAAGRLAEAQQVLGLLKEEEFFEWVRGDAAPATAVSLTATESDLDRRYGEIADQLVTLGAERGAIFAKKPKDRTPEEQARLVVLETSMQAARRNFQHFLDSLAPEMSDTPDAGERQANVEEARTLQKKLRELGPGVVAIYTLVTKNSYRVVLVTPDIAKPASFDIKAADLNREVLKFRQVLQNPDIDPLPQAQKLYKILVGPVAKDLEQAKADTLMWSLDGVLRYLPLSALHDGKSYLAENYRSLLFTSAGRDALGDEPSESWTAAGLGISKSFKGFDALPGVPDELKGIIRTADASSTGILSGTMQLNEQFTEAAFQKALLDRFSVIHIASHFNFQPGDETNSFLLLGNGETLSLARIKVYDFEGVELLTLSACNTAMGSGEGGGQGKEIESFAMLAQKRGAKAVIATLWPVADASTQLLMREFYRSRQAQPGTSKIEAMQAAQLALLRGSLQPPANTAHRGAVLRGKPEPDQMPFKTDPRAPYAHPYYWAPFILMGNWR